MSEKFFRVASQYALHLNLTKIAGRKKVDYKPASKELTKLKEKYSQVHKKMKAVESEYQRISSEREKLRSQTKMMQGQMSRLSRLLNDMEMHGASSAFEYDDGDCSYVIDGKEVYLEADDNNDVKYIPMRERRRAKKKPLTEEEKQQLLQEGMTEEELAQEESASADDGFQSAEFDENQLAEFLENF